MHDLASAVRSVAVADDATAEAAALAERMRALGAWGAYAALRGLTREREARAERIRAMATHAARVRVQAARGRA